MRHLVVLITLPGAILLSLCPVLVARSSDSAPHANALNDTGLTQCRNSANAVIPCNVAPAADEGRYGRDAAATTGALIKVGWGAAGFDFTKIANNGSDLPRQAVLGNGASDWACTRDNVTGLTWEVKTTGPADLRYRDHKYTWFNTNGAENGGNAGSPAVVTYSSCDNSLSACNTQAFSAAVNASSLCGYSDWRLPTPRELRGIVNYSVGQAGSFDTSYFTPATGPDPHYFTESTYAADTADVWLLEIGGEADGGGEGHHHSKGQEQHIVLVRGVQPDSPRGTCAAANPTANVPESTPSSDFTDHGDGTVTHVSTGLMWKRCAEGLSGDTCATGTARSLTWSNAVAAAEDSTYGGFTDWRLPNVKELHSIVETCGYDLAINQSIFPGTPSVAGGPVFWSASTSVATPTDAWLLVFGRGGALPTSKTSQLYVRLVRAGDSLGSFDSQHPPQTRRRAVRK
jgi:hypothetical protein